MQERIKACFTESIQAQIAAAEALPDAIFRATIALAQSLLNGNKILRCDNGTSAASAQHFTASIIDRFETERPSLPAIVLNTDSVVLTAIASDRLHDEVYIKRMQALGHVGDVLLAISTRSDSCNIVKAVEAAITRNAAIVVLIDYDGDELAGLLGPQDVEIRIPPHHSARIRGMRMLAVNCLCDLIDNTLFPRQDVQGEYMKALPPITVLISALLLQDCVAAAAVGIVAIGTKAVTDPRNIGTQVDDGTLEVCMNGTLSKDEQIKKEARINVTAYRDKVLLIEQSPNAELSARARQIAMGADGVSEVHSEIRQGQPISLGEASNDTWVIAKVRSQLLISDLVKSSNVKVTTENGEVFLMGLMTEREARATADIASRVSGVKRVTTAFTFIK